MREDDLPNLNQMIDSVSRDGFVIAQEYLPAAEAGDMRLFVMNGEALKYKGKYAAFRRVRKGGDMRSNLHAGRQASPGRRSRHRRSSWWRLSAPSSFRTACSWWASTSWATS